MIYNSAGHYDKDSGAVATYKGQKIQENKIMMRFRDKISKRILSRGYKVIVDKDSESLSQYLGRIKPGNGSVIHEGHLNASSNPNATGIEVIVPAKPSKEELQLASMIAEGLHKITGLSLRNGGKGVITEKESARGSLGIMRKEGITVLTEFGFISNSSDMDIIFKKEDEICNFIGDCLIYAEDWIN